MVHFCQFGGRVAKSVVKNSKNEKMINKLAKCGRKLSTIGIDREHMTINQPDNDGCFMMARWLGMICISSELHMLKLVWIEGTYCTELVGFKCLVQQFISVAIAKWPYRTTKRDKFEGKPSFQEKAWAFLVYYMPWSPAHRLYCCILSWI